MINWLKRKLRPLKKDELVGRWSNEEGSGISMMYESAVIFNEDGTGAFQGYYNAPKEDDSGDEQVTYDVPFTWTRTNDDTVVITADRQIEVQYLITPYKSYVPGHELVALTGDSGYLYGSHFRF